MSQILKKISIAAILMAIQTRFLYKTHKEVTLTEQYFNNEFFDAITKRFILFVIITDKISNSLLGKLLPEKDVMHIALNIIDEAPDDLFKLSQEKLMDLNIHIMKNPIDLTEHDCDNCPNVEDCEIKDLMKEMQNEIREEEQEQKDNPELSGIIINQDGSFSFNN